MTLQEIYIKHKKGAWPDKGDVHSYLEIYADILAPYRYDTNNNILEIGLMSGESLRMWNEYFSGMVYGIDCDIKPIGGQADLTKAISEGYLIRIGDASNPLDVSVNFGSLRFDVIIEDANHDLEQQVKIYNNLKSYIRKGGVYIIEDIQDINKQWAVLQDIDPEKKIEVIDRRHIKGRYDDVLVIIKNYT